MDKLNPTLWVLSKLPNLDWVKDLEEYEGPLLTQWIDQDNNIWLSKWIDLIDPHANRWLYWRLNHSDRLDLYPQDITLTALMRDGYRSQYWIVDLNTEAEPIQILQGILTSIPKDYWPLCTI